MRERADELAQQRQPLRLHWHSGYLSKNIGQRLLLCDNEPVTALHLSPVQCRVRLTQKDLWRVRVGHPSMVIAPTLIETESPCKVRRMSPKLPPAVIVLLDGEGFRPRSRSR